MVFATSAGRLKAASIGGVGIQKDIKSASGDNYAEELPFAILDFDGFIAYLLSGQTVLGDKSKCFELARECAHCCFEVFIATSTSDTGCRVGRPLQVPTEHDCCI